MMKSGKEVSVIVKNAHLESFARLWGVKNHLENVQQDIIVVLVHQFQLLMIVIHSM